MRSPLWILSSVVLFALVVTLVKDLQRGPSAGAEPASTATVRTAEYRLPEAAQAAPALPAERPVIMLRSLEQPPEPANGDPLVDAADDGLDPSRIWSVTVVRGEQVDVIHYADPDQRLTVD